MKVVARIGNDKERQENKFVVIEAMDVNYFLDCRNCFAFISLFKGAEDFKPFEKICASFKSNLEVEEYLNKNNIKFSK